MAHKHCVLIRYEHLGAYTESPNEFEITIFDDTTQAIEYVRKIQETYPDNTMDEYTKIKEIRFLSTLPGQGVFDKTAGGFDTSAENQSGIRTRDADLATMKAMIKCGGSFVRKLGDAAMHADDSNLVLIKVAFPAYWKKYSDMAKTMPEEGA